MEGLAGPGTNFRALMNRRLSGRQMWHLTQASCATAICSFLFILPFINPDAPPEWRIQHPNLTWMIDHDLAIWGLVTLTLFCLTFGMQAVVAKALPKGAPGYLLQTVLVLILAGTFCTFLLPPIPSKGLLP